ncbi:MAG: hypothetical protein ACPGWS_00060 [Solirubrobacterales bacterium]
MLGKKKSSRLGLAVMVAAIVAMFAFAPGASASGKSNTTLKLDPGTASALTSLGVSVAPVAPATAGPAGVAFPVTGFGGSLFPLALDIKHSGGLALSAGTTTVALTDYTIRLGKKPRLIATVGGARVAILKLDLRKARIRFGWRSLSVGPVKATLTAEAAGALNGAFGVSAFTEGLLLGTATVNLKR